MRGNLNHLRTCKEAYQLWPSLVTPGTKLRPPKRKTVCGTKETLAMKEDTERQAPNQSAHVWKARRISCSPSQRPPLMPLDEIDHKAQPGSGQKSTPREHSLWICLCCSQKHCSFESGVTVFTEEGGDCQEWDPSEMARSEWGTVIQPFDDLRKGISDCVQGIMRSQFFFANNKYIGSPSLDLKIKRWIMWRLHLPPEVLTKNWVPLRRAVKETIRYKRQRCVSRMEEAFIGK
jgi:hypothetical protein